MSTPDSLPGLVRPYGRPATDPPNRAVLSLGVLAQTSEGIIPEDPGARIVFVLVVAGIVGLYLLLRKTRRRAEADYWDRKRREQELRDNDPDLRRDDG